METQISLKTNITVSLFLWSFYPNFTMIGNKLSKLSCRRKKHVTGIHSFTWAHLNMKLSVGIGIEEAKFE